ncbi:hypothetical protein PR048_010572 [Dryococelus australis]|uniref:Uncharacterized protein n=1 Tax=Dryococelus australis TaxID=614101 RepID=A0ABQ9I344_9NEOP|nr:hypothetical protein PR048_010572 [Dryococelus australis]
MKGLEKREIPERTRRPTASSCTIPTCENPGAAQPEIQSDSPRARDDAVSSVRRAISARGVLLAANPGEVLVLRPPPLFRLAEDEFAEDQQEMCCPCYCALSMRTLPRTPFTVYSLLFCFNNLSWTFFTLLGTAVAEWSNYSPPTTISAKVKPKFPYVGNEVIVAVSNFSLISPTPVRISGVENVRYDTPTLRVSALVLIKLHSRLPQSLLDQGVYVCVCVREREREREKERERERSVSYRLQRGCSAKQGVTFCRIDAISESVNQVVSGGGGGGGSDSRGSCRRTISAFVRCKCRKRMGHRSHDGRTEDRTCCPEWQTSALPPRYLTWYCDTPPCLMVFAEVVSCSPGAGATSGLRGIREVVPPQYLQYFCRQFTCHLTGVLKTVQFNVSTFEIDKKKKKSLEEVRRVPPPPPLLLKYRAVSGNLPRLCPGETLWVWIEPQLDHTLAVRVHQVGALDLVNAGEVLACLRFSEQFIRPCNKQLLGAGFVACRPNFKTSRGKMKEALTLYCARPSLASWPVFYVQPGERERAREREKHLVTHYHAGLLLSSIYFHKRERLAMNRTRKRVTLPRSFGKVAKGTSRNEGDSAEINDTSKDYECVTNRFYFAFDIYCGEGLGKFREFDDLWAKLLSPLHTGAPAVCPLAVIPHPAVMGFASPLLAQRLGMQPTTVLRSTVGSSTRFRKLDQLPVDSIEVSAHAYVIHTNQVPDVVYVLCNEKPWDDTWHYNCEQKDPTRVIEVTWSGAGVKGLRKREIPEKTRRPRASSGTISTCENPVTRPGIEPGSPWWEASVLIAQPPYYRKCLRWDSCVWEKMKAMQPLQNHIEAGATVAERLACSPPINVNWVQTAAGSLRISASGNHAGRCRWSAVGGFSRGSPVGSWAYGLVDSEVIRDGASCTDKRDWGRIDGDDWVADVTSLQISLHPLPPPRQSANPGCLRLSIFFDNVARWHQLSSFVQIGRALPANPYHPNLPDLPCTLTRATSPGGHSPIGDCLLVATPSHLHPSEPALVQMNVSCSQQPRPFLPPLPQKLSLCEKRALLQGHGYAPNPPPPINHVARVLRADEGKRGEKCRADPRAGDLPLAPVCDTVRPLYPFHTVRQLLPASVRPKTFPSHAELSARLRACVIAGGRLDTSPPILPSKITSLIYVRRPPYTLRSLYNSTYPGT